jgi:hypothetical protein
MRPLAPRSSVTSSIVCGGSNSPCLHEGAEPGPGVRFCFAKRDETLEAAAGRLREV